MHAAYREHAHHESKTITLNTTTHPPLTGTLHAIDPETGTFAMLTPGPTIHLISASTLQSVTPTDCNAPPVELPPLRMGKGIAPEELVEALLERRVEATVQIVEGDTRVVVFGGVAWIIYPFGVHGCRSMNESVLLKIRVMVADIVENAFAARGHAQNEMQSR